MDFQSNFEASRRGYAPARSRFLFATLSAGLALLIVFVLRQPAYDTGMAFSIEQVQTKLLGYLQPDGQFPVLNNPRCGVYYYYHISKNGGTSVMNWQKAVEANQPGKVEYVEYFDTLGTKDYHLHPWKERLARIDSMVENGQLATQGKWLSVHHHHRSPGLRFMMPTLRKWRTLLQEQGCELILTTTLREPVSRMQSLIQFNHIPRERFEEYVLLERESQVFYILFNTCEPMSEPGVPPGYCATPAGFAGTQHYNKAELEEALGYLKEFDLVAKTTELADFIFWSMAHTGWTYSGSMELPFSNGSHKNFNVTDEMHALIVEHLTPDLMMWNKVFGSG